MEKQGKNHDAVIYYKKSIEAIENVRSKLHLMEHKSAYMQSKMKVYESIVNLLFEMHRKSPHEKFHEEAFLFVERSKARAFFDKLEESDMDLAAGLDPETRAQMDTLFDEMACIQISLKRSGISPERRDSLITSLEKKEEFLRDLMIRIKSKDQKFAEVLSPPSRGYEDVRDRLLNDHTALLEYYIGEKHSFAFLATKEDLHMIRLPDPGKIDRLVDKYLDFLLLNSTREFKGTKGGARLCEMLVGPFDDRLTGPIEKLIIVPDAGLLYLPFEALVKNMSDESKRRKYPRFLIEDFEISYAPSSSALLNIIERNVHGSGRMDLLALASDESVFGLPPLDHAVREVKSIAKLFEKDKKVLLVNDMATEHELKKMELKRFKIIHFATHAIVDTDKWYRSAIVLNHNENTTEDGLLQPQDFFQNDIVSDLVVLSACQTRRGRLEAGEGMFGLTRAFLYSGSRSVLSSLWKIDDKSPSRFMEYFYEYLTEGKTKDAALRLSKIKMMDSKYRHPRYWAAFVLTGDISPLSQED
jgi:CHAT domain-containing protein